MEINQEIQKRIQTFLQDFENDDISNIIEDNEDKKQSNIDAIESKGFIKHDKEYNDLNSFFLKYRFIKVVGDKVFIVSNIEAIEDAEETEQEVEEEMVEVLELTKAEQFSNSKFFRIIEKLNQLSSQ